MAQRARTRQRRRAGGGGEPKPDSGAFNQQAAYHDLKDAILGIYRNGGATPQVTDAITQALLTVLGSGPAFAALETLVSASQANGLMYANSVAQQQAGNDHAMATLTACVKSLLNLDNQWAEAEIADPPQTF